MADKDRKEKTMLIADDVLINRVLLRNIFSADYRIVEADNGVEALRKLREIPEVEVLVLDISMPELDGFGVLAIMQEDSRLKDIPTVVVTASNDEETQIRALMSGAMDVLSKPFSPQVIFHRIKNIVSRKEADRLAEENRVYEMELCLSEIDEKTGLYNKQAFIRHTTRFLQENPGKKYVLLRWDIDNFKAYNDFFGTDCGDDYLRKVGEFYLEKGKNIPGMITYARFDADHFVCCREADTVYPQQIIDRINQLIAGGKDLAFEYTPRMGLYLIDDPTLDVVLMCDRALMALRSIKNRYNEHYAWYDESMRQTMIEEQEIVNEMEHALREGQFQVYLQPQYNHDLGALIGAEALVRWVHPRKGIIVPSKFLPLFERNGFISVLDRYVWEQSCILLRKWQDQGLPPISVSVNISRRDIYNMELSDVFLSLLDKYNIDPALLHLEITETAYSRNADRLIGMVNELRSNGLRIYMDDFGSGYSSLNMLKSVPVDMLKLDMKFLESAQDNDRGESILNAVIRMADALKLPVLAEGVETREQADMLKSIGCFLMQGFYFARPMPVSEFEELLRCEGQSEAPVHSLNVFSESAFLFSGIVAGAALVEYDRVNDVVAVMRINDRYLNEMNMSRIEYLHRSANVLDSYDSFYREVFLDMLDKAAKTGQETSCELLTNLLKEEPEQIWLRLRAWLMIENAGRDVFCIAIENITESKLLALRNEELIEQFTAIVDSIPGGVLNFEIKGKSIRTTFVSRKTAELAGYTPEEYRLLFYDDPFRIVHPDDREHLKEGIWEGIANKKEDFTTTYRHLCKDGQWHWTQITARIIRQQEESLLGNAVIMDVHSSGCVG